MIFETALALKAIHIQRFGFLPPVPVLCGMQCVLQLFWGSAFLVEGCCRKLALHEPGSQLLASSLHVFSWTRMERLMDDAVVS